jgi:hypothetical protein
MNVGMDLRSGASSFHEPRYERSERWRVPGLGHHGGIHARRRQTHQSITPRPETLKCRCPRTATVGRLLNG